MKKNKKSVTEEIVEPDSVAQDVPDNTALLSFPIVGIGASAGGLAAFEAFFSGMPKETDPGMAFVLVQHLAPDHKSILTELVRRYTRMQVFEVEDGMVVRPNCAYIIPPNRDMAFLNGTLQLMEPSAPRGQRLPIDFFFRSLAQDQHERAICIVLSGTGSDGTLGVRAIKGEGGMVMVQNPASTEYDGMPRSAIATGLVDYELPPAEMPAQLMAYVSHAFGHPPVPSTTSLSKTENSLKKIFIILRAQTGHDFSQYKPSTINRRIERRLAIHQIKNLDLYIKYLQQTPKEVDALFRDLLIGVTNFFRDPEAFKELETQIIPKIFAAKSESSFIRIWSPGCSTGEEAYSLAILLQEQMDKLKRRYKIQIFATDIDSQAIVTARAGLYPASIASDISPERLERFFTAESAGSVYRIHKTIRDLIVFSEQDIVKDPPFSKMDMISCRNLLIYMGGDLQKKLIPLFHYALNPGGFLFLGTSETVGEFGDMFTVISRKAKIYQRKDDFHSIHRVSLGRLIPPLKVIEMPNSKESQKADSRKISLRELTEGAILKQIAPAVALVNSLGDILYLHGRSGKYLEPAPGESSVNNVLKMAREGLRPELTKALHKAATGQENVYRSGLKVKTNGDFTSVNLTVHRLAISPDQKLEGQETPLYLVILADAQPDDQPDLQPPYDQPVKGGKSSSKGRAGDASIAALQAELRAKEEYLQTANEELETSNEELKSSNEEMQSVNEELQSTNEELETSKEELQSVNEELATVNNELQTKVNDLARTNNDMNNLLAGTGIATVFVDHQLHILRFTPSASQIINLIQSDMGRPVGHILTNLESYRGLIDDTNEVLKTLIPKEIVVRRTDGKWFSLRIQPYRTLDNVIEGAVLTFVDVTELKKIKEQIGQFESLNRLAVVVRDSQDAITVQDLEGRILAWNPGAERLYGWTESEAINMNVQKLIPKELLQDNLKRVKQLANSKVLEPFHTQRLAKDGRLVNIWMTATALLNETGQVYAIASTEKSE